MSSPPSTGDDKVLQMTRPGMQEAFENVIDTLTGAHGGTGAYMLMRFCSQLDKQAADGDKDAAEILSCVTRLSRLINIAKKGGKVT